MGCNTSMEFLMDPKSFGGVDEFHRQYFLGKKLGSGGFGVVRSCKPRSSPDETERFAVKVMSPFVYCTAEANTFVKQVLQEECAWRKVSGHPHIVKLHETFLSDSDAGPSVYFLMERCRGSLLDCATLGNEANLAEYARDMLSGLAHVHSNLIVHRDIKLDNFLMSYHGGRVLLADFGLARLLTSKDYVSGQCGTVPYFAPEVVVKRRCDFSSDIWAFGVCMHLLTTGRHPYTPAALTSAAVKKAIVEGKEPSFLPLSPDWPELSAIVKDFTASLLHRDKLLRPTASDALQHNFLQHDTEPAALHQEVWESARQRTLEFNQLDDKKLDDAFQRNIDEVLLRLQEQYGPSLPVRRAFTDERHGKTFKTFSKVEADVMKTRSLNAPCAAGARPTESSWEDGSESTSTGSTSGQEEISRRAVLPPGLLEL